MAVVLITGCSSGIGLDAALAFARRGETTYASMRNVAKATALQDRASAEGLDIEVVQLDVTDEDSVAAAIGAIEAEHGAVDILVNNAGIGSSGPIETIDLKKAAAVYDTNIWGAVRTVRAALPAMRAKGSGVIINVTSVAGRVPGAPYGGFYASSKHALGSLSEALAWEVNPFGIRVACVEPGFFNTEIFASSDWKVPAPQGAYEADQDWLNSFYVLSGEAAGADPAVAGNFIADVAADPDAPMHNLIGEDAYQFVDLVKQADTFEGWIPVATGIIEGVSGPRPI
jgi:NAD(P)-dependent dehydrogenase (short-subunit alcohol dehydrogenase family)